MTNGQVAEINYSLNREQTLLCLRRLAAYRNKRQGNIIKTVLLLFFGTCFFISFFWYDHSIRSLIFAVLCYALTGIQWYVSESDIRRRSGELVDGITITALVYPERLVICKQGTSREILLNGTSNFNQFSGLWVITTPDGNITAIPEDTVIIEKREEIRILLEKGTFSEDI